MKGVRIMVGLMLLACLALGLVSSGCEDYSGQGTGGADEAIAMMEMLPAGGEMFMFYSVSALREDEDLSAVYEDLGSEYGFEDFGVGMDDVDAIAAAGEIFIIEGDGLADALAGTFGAYGAEEQEYGGAAYWSMQGFALAVKDGALIAGSEVDVKACIDLMNGEGDSLYEDENYQDIIDVLPEGFAYMVMEGQFDQEMEMWDGLLMTGMSMNIKDSTTALVTGVWMFEDAASAEAALDEAEAFIEGEEDVTLLDLEVDGKYIIGTVEQPVDGLL
jgi:hypothetical protein